MDESLILSWLQQLGDALDDANNAIHDGDGDTALSAIAEADDFFQNLQTYFLAPAKPKRKAKKSK